MIFTSNLGSFDRILRIVIGIALLVYAILISGIELSSPTGIGIIVVAVVLIATAFISFCPLYRIIGVGTRKKESP